MTYTVFFTEVNHGSAVFDTKEDAESFLEEIDYDLVTWDFSEVTKAFIWNGSTHEKLIPTPD